MIGGDGRDNLATEGIAEGIMSSGASRPEAVSDRAKI